MKTNSVNGVVKMSVLARNCTMVFELEEEGLTNKEIRFQLYQQAIYELHGHLGQGNRKELPDCVYADIHDLYHDKEYVGFKNA